MRAEDKINEDAIAPGATNAVNGGGIEGIGFGAKGEPGVKPKKKLRSIITNTPLSRIKPAQ